MEKKIAIIGGGISGLRPCKYILSKGFHPIVFEAKSSIGGVWTNTVETTLLQTPKPAYEFSDFPWPQSVTELFPSSKQVLDYIQSYASHFDLIKYIKFNTKVVGINYEAGPSSDEEMESWSHWGANGEPFSSKGKWEIEVQNSQGKLSTSQVDFVILCLGRFSDVPNIPEFPQGKGPEVFNGEVIHAMDYINMDNESATNFVKAGKKITVVGLQKFAMDIAMECSAANGVENPCTLLYRTEHWNLPDYFPWGIPIGYFYLNRFSELLVHKPGETFFHSLLATCLSPVRWGFSKFVESHIKKKLRLEKFGMVPKHSFLQEINSCTIATIPDHFYDKQEEGSIILKKSPNFSFNKQGLDVETGDSIETDLVILATGFRGDNHSELPLPLLCWKQPLPVNFLPRSTVNATFHVSSTLQLTRYLLIPL